jgi:hypothetical protein
MYYIISRAFIGIPGIIYCTVFPIAYTANPPKTPYNVDRQDWPHLCSCLFLFPQTAYCSAKGIYHPILYYIALAKCSYEDCYIPNRKNNLPAIDLWELLEPAGDDQDGSAALLDKNAL